jgi:biopolymer transport protein TolR
MMTQGLDVDLPETTAKALRQKEDPQVFTVDKDGKISLNGTEIPQAMVTHELAKLPEEMKEQPVYLRADRNVPYGLVVTLMSDIKAAGFDKLGMITQPEEKTN